jgi:hypothetical protein
MKPTADECLDTLAVLWAHVAEAQGNDIGALLDKMDRDVPHWKVSQLPLGHQNDNGVQALLRLKAWSRCRDVLTRAGRL